MANVNYIVTAKHYAAREGAASVADRIKKLAREIGNKRNMLIIPNLDSVSARPVYARIELGQWVADCECGGCEFVDHTEPIFYCFSCANRDDASKVRPVVFPEPALREEIEALILARPVEDKRGLDDLDRAFMARPFIVSEQADGSVIPLTRTWTHGEDVENLKRENKVIELIKDKRGKK